MSSLLGALAGVRFRFGEQPLPKNPAAKGPAENHGTPRAPSDRAG